ncbi:PIG-L family deacetylase [Oscillochloris sp. ZM17-4]|uniref:PIG-L deacetylase family protein n=1 Tax=Oscillochloris sp. ZM17-4 TaxID=2866714 RepID=UPI001C72B2F5|nr:PIG-L family deacetylase [Oscillochloris sp. ZM17-4]MBX0327252.1 PIG-L family deacetylase [Oscillochloris sp. ZM17-4]
MPHHYISPDDLAATYDHIYLSPHLDDAALSCGGSIARFVGAGQTVLVVNICAGSPPAAGPFSPFAQRMHRQWGLPPDEAVRRRTQEDVEALETLGADCLLLGLLDAIYRMPEAYVGDETLFGTVAPDDTLADSLRGQVAALAARYPAAIFYAPLGVGQHVDHQATYEVAVGLAQSGLSMAFYEDFPYVAVPGALDRRMAQIGGAEIFLPSVTGIDATLARKISAVEAYASQISTLFGDLATMAERVTAYAEGLRPEAGTYGERIWMRR